MKETDYPLLSIADRLQIEEVVSKHSHEERLEVLVRYLEDLIQSDFNKLISILYRIDVSEEKVRKALTENQNKISAGQIIAGLLIEREWQKIQFRAKFKK